MALRIPPKGSDCAQVVVSKKRPSAAEPEKLRGGAWQLESGCLEEMPDPDPVDRNGGLV